MKKEIDLYLISGFLGSGKTTFLQKLLNNLEGLKVGVLVNEFGSTGIDGTVIEKEGIRLVEINNGSIFCSCIKGNFINTLIEFTSLDIDVLVIENSGMADPSNIHQIIDEVSERVLRQYHYMGAVCILDAVSFLKQVKILVPVQNQVASSNFIIINKMDLVNNSTLDEIRKVIRELNPEAFSYVSMFSEVPMELLHEKLIDNGYVGESSNMCYNRPASYSLEGDGEYTVEQIRTFAEQLNSYVLRMKGLVKGKKNEWWKVDVVNNQITITEIGLGKRDMIKKTKLVIIGHDTEEFMAEAELSWRVAFGDVPVIFE